ncbi:glutamate racemase [Chromobacterium violaceum]|uniref:glutamate racemase n=1 Tax=Chromobacterium violaceum TaxID=536 RepID=UPI001B342DC3|nr:aspartate/glutamate racemase family protein [Chromobacterium violaceum]MBP4043851.1 aspartate/glutamate racemase family protein [Chromobacterium violaceum]
MIGVFDFGSGGLTVMRAFESFLPNEKFIYLGDHGNPPYGKSSSDDIYDLTQAALARLFEHGCSLVVIACNTAVATSLRKIQQTWLPEAYPDRRVVGVIVPTVEEIVGTPWDLKFDSAHADSHRLVKSVAIFATQHTVQSNIFAAEINSRNPDISVRQQACNGLALLIEQAAPEAVLRAEIRKNINALFSAAPEVPDVCILGCTHYPIVEHIWRTELPDSMRIISQPDACAQSLVEYLKRNPHFSSTRIGSTQFLTTGDAETVSERASLFYNSRVEFSKIDM